MIHAIARFIDIFLPVGLVVGLLGLSAIDFYLRRLLLAVLDFYCAVLVLALLVLDSQLSTLN